jgi:hypothetical protein
MLPSGIQRRVVCMWTYVPKERITSIVRVKNEPLIFYPDNGSDTLIRNVGSDTDYMVQGAISQKMATFIYVGSSDLTFIRNAFCLTSDLPTVTIYTSLSHSTKSSAFPLSCVNLSSVRDPPTSPLVWWIHDTDPGGKEACGFVGSEMSVVWNKCICVSNKIHAMRSLHTEEVVGSRELNGEPV